MPLAESNGVAIEVFYHRLSIRWPIQPVVLSEASPRGVGVLRGGRGLLTLIKGSISGRAILG